MKRYALGVALAILLAIAVVFRPGRALEFIQTATASPWFPLFLIGLYAIRPFLGWPISVLSLLVGYQYGLVTGIPVALAGAVLTCVPAYYFGMRAPTDGRLFGRFTDGSIQYFEGVGGFRGLLAARLVPAPPEPVSAAAGAGGLRVHVFTLATLFGELPWVVAMVAIGSGLDSFTMTAAIDWRLIVGGILISALLVGPIAYRTWKKHQFRAEQ